MRFLTVQELMPRRELGSWCDDWSHRVDRFLRGTNSTGTRSENLHLLYNEGTLLLYRLGDRAAAKAHCQAVLRRRRLPEGRICPTFLIQQWVNLARLDAATRRWSAVRKRMALLSSKASAGQFPLTDSESEKVAAMCFVEQLSVALAQADNQSVSRLYSALQDPVRDACRPCALEVEIRCLIKTHQGVEARRRIESELPASAGPLRLALLVLKTGVTALKMPELNELEGSLRQQLDEIPVHAVQVGEYLFRNGHPENVRLMTALSADLLRVSVAVADASAAEYFAEHGRGTADTPGPLQPPTPRESSANIQSRTAVRDHLARLLDEYPTFAR